MKSTTRKATVLFLSLAIALTMVACSTAGNRKSADPPSDTPSNVPAEASSLNEGGKNEGKLDKATIYVDAAASLETVFENVIIPAYKEVQPNVTIVANYGSSGKLLAGIQETNGIGHDIFFSAGKAQVATLDERDGLVVADTIINLLTNQLCLVKGVDTQTAVIGWDNLSEAKVIALCGGSVPVGRYSRIALVSLGLLPETDDPSDYTSDEISTALGGVQIDEADDVEVAASKAVEAVVDVATIYYSDYYNHQDDLTILAQDDGTLTGDIIYPVCQVDNPEADEAETAAAADFLAFLQTDVCLCAYEDYCFIVNK